MRQFYRKTLYDWLDAMKDTAFIDTAPFVGIIYCGLSWESAFIITQYYLYLYYNDIELVRELYEQDLAWMEKVDSIHPDGIVRKGLSDHESLVKVPVELIGTAHYYQCARIMEKFARLMNDRKNEDNFRGLSEKLGKILVDSFWSKPVPDPVNRQTLFSTLLFHDLLRGEDKITALDSLFKAISSAPSGHFTTGIFGTKYILESLSSSGKTDSVFRIVHDTRYPGWGHMISQGATTIWETWKESDNVYSNCHPMFGSVTEWFYRWLAGIRPDPENPGFKKFIIAPTLPHGLEYVRCSYRSPFGKIISNWKRDGEFRQTFEMVIPEGSSAMIRLPVSGKQKIFLREKSGKESFSPERDGASHMKFVLGPGDYNISVEGSD
jgi:alpha-L-rhamnosidase